jgi:hypothetical protein
MLRAFDDYYIEDCGVILAPEVTQRRIDNSDQFVILAHRQGSFCAGLPLIFFVNTYTLTFLFKQEHMVVRV